MLHAEQVADSRLTFGDGISLRAEVLLQALNAAAATAARLEAAARRVHLAIDGFMLPPLSEFLTLRGLLHSRHRHSLPMTARTCSRPRRETLQDRGWTGRGSTSARPSRAGASRAPFPGRA